MDKFVINFAFVIYANVPVLAETETIESVVIEGEPLQQTFRDDPMRVINTTDST